MPSARKYERKILELKKRLSLVKCISSVCRLRITCEFWHPSCHVVTSQIQHLFELWCVSVGESLVGGTRCVHEVLEETHAEVRPSSVLAS